MNKRIKIVGLGVVIGLILIQFYKPDKNLGPIEQEMDLLQVASIPDNLGTLFRNACYDCHSNHTNYPWYNKISPVSLIMDRHIRKGKEDLNLSHYGSLEKAGKIGSLSDIYDAVEAGKMPLQSYKLMHGNARLSQEEIDAICDWTERESFRIMKE